MIIQDIFPACKRNYLMKSGEFLMCPSSQELIDSYAFYFLQNVSAPVVQLLGVGREIRCSSDYNWDNAQRSSCHLLQYTLSGHGMVRIGNEHIRVEPGTAFMLSLPSDTGYYCDPASDEPWEFLFVMFSGDAVAPYLDLIRERNGLVFSLPLQHAAVQHLLDLHAQARSSRLQDAFTASSQMFSILCALCSPSVDHTHKPSPLISAAITAMRVGFAQGISIADVCETLHVSQSHLSRAFIKETGVQPIIYLTRLRLEEAVHLLNTTDMSVHEISARCGFDNSNYFSKVFRKHMGVSPRDFRQQLLSQQQYNSVQL